MDRHCSASQPYLNPHLSGERSQDQWPIRPRWHKVAPQVVAFLRGHAHVPEPPSVQTYGSMSLSGCGADPIGCAPAASTSPSAALQGHPPILLTSGSWAADREPLIQSALRPLPDLGSDVVPAQTQYSRDGHQVITETSHWQQVRNQIRGN